MNTMWKIRVPVIPRKAEREEGRAPEAKRSGTCGIVGGETIGVGEGCVRGMIYKGG
jgi:hypothetical protein